MKLTKTKIKVLCLLLFIGIAVVVLFTGNKSFVHHTLAFSSGPPSGTSGAPGESTCASCHGGGGTGVGQFTITAPQSYTPGQTYQIVVRHQTTDNTRRRWGFLLTSLSGTTPAGTFANLNTNTQTIDGSNGRRYVAQTSEGTFAGQASPAQWTFNWTAPATNVGPVTFYAAGNQANNNGSTSGDQIYTTNVAVPPAAVVPRHVVADFDGDGRSDLSVFRPSTGEWFGNRSTAGFFGIPWGAGTDKPVPADYDGDDKTDLAVWRESAVSNFYILNSTTNTLRSVVFGQTGDVPTVGDWDGDGKADPSVYRAGTGGGQSFFYYLNSTNNNVLSSVPWGASGDLAVRGDFDGDNKFDATVFRPSDATWYIRQSSNGALVGIQWGLASDRRVAADYDGDGKTDVAVRRGGSWFIRQSSNGSLFSFDWGLASDVPVPADYDGDAKTDIAVFRNGNWYLRLSGNGSFSSQFFGAGTDIAVPSYYIP